MQSPKHELRELYTSFLKGDPARRHLRSEPREDAFRGWLASRSDADTTPDFDIQTLFSNKWLSFFWWALALSLLVPVFVIEPLYVTDLMPYFLIVGAAAIILEGAGLKGFILLKIFLGAALLYLAFIGYSLMPAFGAEPISIYGMVGVALLSIIMITIGKIPVLVIAEENARRHLNGLYERWVSEDPGRDSQTRRCQLYSFRTWLENKELTWDGIPNFSVRPSVIVILWRLGLIGFIGFIGYQIYLGLAQVNLEQLPAAPFEALGALLIQQVALLILAIIFLLPSGNSVHPKANSSDDEDSATATDDKPEDDSPADALAMPAAAAAGAAATVASVEPAIDEIPDANPPKAAWTPPIPEMGAALPAATLAVPPVEEASAQPVWTAAIPEAGAALPLTPAPEPVAEAPAEPVWTAPVPEAGAALPLTPAPEPVAGTTPAEPVWTAPVPEAGAALPLTPEPESVPEAPAEPVWTAPIPEAGAALPIASTPEPEVAEKEPAVAKEPVWTAPVPEVGTPLPAVVAETPAPEPDETPVAPAEETDSSPTNSAAPVITAAPNPERLRLTNWKAKSGTNRRPGTMPGAKPRKTGAAARKKSFGPAARGANRFRKGNK